MKKENLLVKKWSQLIPYEDEDKKILDKVKEGEFVSFSTYDVRSVLYHRRFFKLLSKVLDHIPEKVMTYTDKETGLISDRYTSVDTLLIELKLQLGYYDLHITLGGKEIYVPRSIDFKNMSQMKFQKFVKVAQPVILKRFIPDITSEVFEKEFLNLMFD